MKKGLNEAQLDFAQQLFDYDTAEGWRRCLSDLSLEHALNQMRWMLHDGSTPTRETVDALASLQYLIELLARAENEGKALGKYR